ncbi:sigma factor-like helix-turn-helix DNA-binding protein [Prosthecobacter sp.]|uniref:sigma factor-like helix-turn-helix DNA-binding protein n=1 Tax=Prosthecobacter sp. TaxID=1965333 RepID=UPI002ABA6765|nr:sigma factor-like helix-turn-helix DNA-binding protein [Prosthecobacter sp.]MDZ4403502.1 sigma factor-like helix-turn-helix DNA-binding protein [Prosthecobacter sp.]
MKLLTEPLNESQKQVIALRDQGLNYVQIARTMGFSKSRAQAMETDARRRLQDFAQNGRDALCLLPQWVLTFLKQTPWATRAEVRAAMDSGELRWDEAWRCIRYREMIPPRGGGQGIWQILCEWAGLPPPFPERVVICPHCGGKVPL